MLSTVLFMLAGIAVALFIGVSYAQAYYRRKELHRRRQSKSLPGPERED